MVKYLSKPIWFGKKYCLPLDSSGKIWYSYHKQVFIQFGHNWEKNNFPAFLNRILRTTNKCKYSVHIFSKYRAVITHWGSIKPRNFFTPKNLICLEVVLVYVIHNFIFVVFIPWFCFVSFILVIIELSRNNPLMQCVWVSHIWSCWDETQDLWYWKSHNHHICTVLLFKIVKKCPTLFLNFIGKKMGQ